MAEARGKENEEAVIKLLNNAGQVAFEGKRYRILFAEKPQYLFRMEGKTDCFICLEEIAAKTVRYVKVSLKQTTADFIENKCTENRMSQIFGSGWRDRTKPALAQAAARRVSTWKKSNTRITLGYRWDFVNKPGAGNFPMNATYAEVLEVYSGQRLPPEKRNVKVRNQLVHNAGVADYMLVGQHFKTAQEIMDTLVSVEEYCKGKDLYLTLRAVNLFPETGKLESRWLAGVCEYDSKNNLSHININDPLRYSSKMVKNQLLDQMKIKSTV